MGGEWIRMWSALKSNGIITAHAMFNGRAHEPAMSRISFLEDAVAVLAGQWQIE